MENVSRAGLAHEEGAVFTIAVVMVVALLAASSFSFFTGTGVPGSSAPSALPQGFGVFQSYSELQSFIAANAGSAQRYGRQGIMFGGPVVLMGGLELGLNDNVFTATATPSASSTPTYTGTNVQVQGVDEPDRVKTDGTHLFVSTSDAVAIISAYPSNSTSTISTIAFKGATVLGIEISQDRLLVFIQRSSYASYVDLLLYDTSISRLHG